ncbi:MAG: hypothetical protein PHT44_04250 [Candidatus Portnoybacteria bacterium]|nr:hypothetical protein [Candidatus Portnoybacteria bacterium]MDD4983121.1 hypothetical protein [Candidatus Portnoybacteria bacterium]
MRILLKKPGAWLPIAMSLAMLAYILIYIAMFGVSAPDPNADEGAPARVFQIWMALEALAVIFFAIKWLPQKPKQALAVLALQIAAALAPIAIIFFLEL